jgi:hypothetical protein
VDVRVKLIGLMSWYDEHSSWLSGAIASHYRAGMTHLIAVDGAYELFPDGRARSGAEQHRAISETCEGLGVSSTIYAPQTVWHGNEVEKRSFLFNLGLVVADGPQDWFVIIDADHLMADPDDLRPHLEATDLHAAEFMTYQRPDPTIPEALQFKMPRVHQSTARLAYRANPGLRCRDNHYTYVDGEGRILWSQGICEPALRLDHVRVEHRTRERDIARHESQYTYYRRRDQLAIERVGNFCDWRGCDAEQTTTVPFDFEVIKGGDALQAGYINVCAKHAKRVHYENRANLAKLDIDYGKEGELLKRPA